MLNSGCTATICVVSVIFLLYEAKNTGINGVMLVDEDEAEVQITDKKLLMEV